MAVRLGTLLLLCALALAGCGGSRGPSIDRDLAAKLANQAEATAAAKDPCAARTHARILQRQTIAATNAGRIPTTFQEPLLARVNELVSELDVRCLPKPAAAATTPAPTPKPKSPSVQEPKPGGGPGWPGWRGHGRGRGHDR
jgi:hypothetical protein